MSKLTFAALVLAGVVSVTIADLQVAAAEATGATGFTVHDQRNGVNVPF